MSGAPYQPLSYWTERFGKRLDLDAVGYQGLGVGLNTWMYLARRVAVRRILRRHGISVEGGRVAEVGIGSGYWIDEWCRSRASRILGVDITRASVQRLVQRYPQHTFLQCDVGVPGALSACRAGESFDLVVAMEILLHLTEPSQFSAALDNLCEATLARGHILISDLFLPVEVSAFHQVSRTLAQYAAEMEQRGFRLVARTPVFLTLHPTEFGRRGAAGRWLGRQRWRLLVRLMRLFPTLGWVIGAPMFAIDVTWQRWTSNGPSTHLTLWQRA